VAWNPVISGPDYLKSLAVPSYPSDHAGGGVTLAETVTVNGFRLGEEMRREIAAIDLGPLLLDPVPRTLLLVTDPASAPAGLASPPVGRLEISYMPDLRPWIEDPDNMGAVPVLAIQRIADWLS